MSQFIEMFGTSESNEKGWKICSFGEKFSITSGGTPNTQIEEYWNGNISWIGSNCCQNCILTENDGKYITEEGFNHCSAKMYKPDTILVALVGATIGKVAYLKFDTCTNQNVAGIEIKNRTEFEPMFIYYLLQNMYQRFFMLGMGKFKMASLGFIKSLPLMIPPMELQQRFVSIAEQADKSGFVGVKSQFIEMFGTVQANGTLTEKMTVEEISEQLFAGGDKPKDASDVMTDEYRYPIIANGIGESGIIGYSKSYRVDKDSLTVSARGTIGYCSIRKPYFTPVVRLITIIPKKCIHLLYLKYYFEYVGFEYTGAIQGQLTIPLLKEKKVLVPPMELQQQFVSIADQADKSGYYN